MKNRFSGRANVAPGEVWATIIVFEGMSNEEANAEISRNFKDFQTKIAREMI